ncbi:DinB family protein [Gordonia sp. SL306]|uniref:DinB family protein n=1 Tax=Gordonia sp. SL306 TaxID=2995145 RepID=UPI00226F4388|nr:DinB family protein [Gordonia sp. SL306]WAC57472.1 DinB family protein [Gordonia sp. SL306]
MAGTYTPVALPFTVAGEKEDLLTLLADQRALFKVTVRGITEEQARKRTTVSDLTLGGLVKHLALGEQNTLEELRERDETAEFDMTEAEHAYDLTDGETLAGWLDEYDRAAAELDEYVAEVGSLDELIPQPTAPWQPEREWWTIRKMMLHKLRETAHHSGHADIIREALDGQSTMGALFTMPDA